MILCVTLYGHNIAKVMRRHEDQLEKARIEAEDANNAKSRFLASMSHEIRTPMNGVLGMVSTLLGARLDPSERENIQIIKNPGEELLYLLNDILDLSKIAAGKIDLEHVDISIADLLSSTAALWQSRANLKSLDFTLTDARQNRKTLRIDGGRLRQILFNLIGNAIKFTESGGVHVTVTELNREDDNIGLQFEVRDTGVGIAEFPRRAITAARVSGFRFQSSWPNSLAAKSALTARPARVRSSGSPSPPRKAIQLISRIQRTDSKRYISWRI